MDKFIFYVIGVLILFLIGFEVYINKDRIFHKYKDGEIVKIYK